MQRTKRSYGEGAEQERQDKLTRNNIVRAINNASVLVLNYIEQTIEVWQGASCSGKGKALSESKTIIRHVAELFYSLAASETINRHMLDEEIACSLLAASLRLLSKERRLPIFERIGE